MPKGIHVHKLTNHNLEEKTADCAKCGLGIDIRIKGAKSYCREGIKEQVRIRRPYVHRDRRPGRHGLTLAEVRAIKEDSQCDICGSKEDLKVDHDHATNVLRGVLCHKHNLALGLFMDDTNHLLSAVQYLSNPPGVNIGNA